MQGKAEIRETVAGYAAAILRGEEVSLYSHWKHSADNGNYSFLGLGLNIYFLDESC